MTSIPPFDATGWAGACLLPHRVVLRAQGPDAAEFLHGQLSQDVVGLPPHEARLSAYCSAKGRMLADALLLRPDEHTVWLVLGADIAEATLKRLSLFIMRSRLTLQSLQHGASVVGALGSALPPTVASAPPWTVQSVADGPGAAGSWITLPKAHGVARALWVGPREGESPPALPGTPQEAATALARWRWLEVQSGIPSIEAASVDRFVPQMLNFEVVGGVNFRKGCYPGQEVVARSQYRGTLKRRLYLAHAPTPLQAGQDLFTPEDPLQPAGRVVNAAPHPERPSEFAALVELKIAAEHTVVCTASEGPNDGAQPLVIDPLPYALTSPTD